MLCGPSSELRQRKEVPFGPLGVVVSFVTLIATLCVICEAEKVARLRYEVESSLLTLIEEVVPGENAVADPSKVNKLIYVHGKVHVTPQRLIDKDTGVRVLNAVTLRRTVEHFEIFSSSTGRRRHEAGVWTESTLQQGDSADADEAGEGAAPRRSGVTVRDYHSAHIDAGLVKVGPYRLSGALVEQLEDLDHVPVFIKAADVYQQRSALLSAKYRARHPGNDTFFDGGGELKILEREGQLYRSAGADPEVEPQQGDMRFTYDYVMGGVEVSILARQLDRKGRLGAHPSSSPYLKDIELLDAGWRDPESMLREHTFEEKLEDSALRGVCWLALNLGFMMGALGLIIANRSEVPVLGHYAATVARLGNGVASAALATSLHLAAASCVWMPQHPRTAGAVLALVAAHVAAVSLYFKPIAPRDIDA